MTFTVLVTAPDLAPAGRAVLDAADARVLFLPKGTAPAEVEALLRREPVDAIISRTMKLTAALIDAAPGLKVIARHGIGYDIVDLDAATRRGIPVLVTPGTNGQSVAEMTIGLMLAAARGITAHDTAIRAGNWDRSAQGIQLSGRTLGLVGYGGIGRAVATIAQAIGMKILAYDPVASLTNVAVAGSLDELLAQADVLSLHCPLTADNRHLIGAAQLATLKRGSLVVNTARGGLIDEQALADALASGHIAGAGLDTQEQEPPAADSPLGRLANVVMTPHAGGSTGAALDATAAAAARHALLVLRGEPVPPGTCVNPSVLERKSA